MSRAEVYAEDGVRAATLAYFSGDELATDAWMGKYALKNKEGEWLELDPDDMHRRLATEFTRIEDRFPNPLRRDEIYLSLKAFDYIVPQGSPMFGIGNNFVNCSLSNCLVVDSPKDSVVGITKTAQELALLFRARMGCGVDISTLRPEGMSVNNPAKTSSGAWSFADFYSFVCRMIGSNGRRGALMVTMDVRHPDIYQFVTMKQDLMKVTGANVSIRISDDFMEAVEADTNFDLRFPVDSEDPIFTKTIKAKELWDQVVDCATRTAEPGLLMWDNIIKNLPAHEYADFKTISTNPCSEIPLSKLDSCRLISINLKNFVDSPFNDDAKFDFAFFKTIVQRAMRLSDDLVELELEKIKKFIEGADEEEEKTLFQTIYDVCAKGRRTGLGTHGLADVFCQMQMDYDSDEALKLSKKIYTIMRDEAYKASVELAKERGAFPVFSWETEKNNAFIKRLPDDIQTQIALHGRRNISILTGAPTGTVSLLSQTSSGIEPIFRLSYTRRKKINHGDTNTKVDFVDPMGDRWQEYEVLHHGFQEYLDRFPDHGPPSFFKTSDQIDWKKKVELQAVIQKNIDHAISVTNNLPKGTPASVVGELYLLGHKLGLKGITVYVDGSRTGVLVTKDDPTAKEVFPQLSAPKRPMELSCRIHRASIKGVPWVVLIGLLDCKPYEVFGGLSSNIEIPKKYESGTLVKHPRKTTNSIYDLKFGDPEDEIIIHDVNKIFDNPTHASLTRMISLALRHGAKVKYVVEQIGKDPYGEMFDFASCIARILKKYINDNEEVSGEKCPECQSKLIYADGCKRCSACSFSVCL